MAFFPKSLCLFLALSMAAIVSSSHAFTLEVGGSNGWTLNPPETYSAWAQRLRFSVNDTLHFKYNSATDSVLVVSNADFDNCNANNPITKLNGNGDSSFTFDRSGPFFFITGNKTNCDQGQKIHIVVLAIRNAPSANSPALSPSANASAPTTPSPAPAEADTSPAPANGTTAPPAQAAEAPARSSARATFNADSTVPFVMIFSFVCLLVSYAQV